MANVKIPYAMVPAVALPQRREHMRSAIARGLPRLSRLEARPDALHVACYGPSLRDTWRELIGKRPIISMSGATRFLADRGIVADWALEMDPRASQLVVSLPPVPGVTYVVASCVDPKYLDEVLGAGNKVVLWHTVSSNWDDELAWVSQHDHGALVVHAGSTVGLGALHVGGVLGFRRFEIHGMDGSFSSDGARHAGPHGGREQKDAITWDAGGRTYRTSKIMSNAVAETVNTAKNFPMITIWHGDGLTQALIREANLRNACCADEDEKRAGLSGLQPRVVAVPAVNLSTHRTVWDGYLASLTPDDLPELVANIATCEALRAKARYATGTVPFETAAMLRAFSRFYEPAVVVEVGTFIGTSTLALRPSRVIYTCDRSNDCLPSRLEDAPNVITHPFRSSTEMLREIQEQVDMFFFDGRLVPDDVAEIVRLGKPGTVYLFDDHNGDEKGVANVRLLSPSLPHHTLVLPAKGSTLAALVPYVQKARKDS